MQILRKMLDFLSPQERKRAYLLLGMILVMALVDMIGVASIMPFMASFLWSRRWHKYAGPKKNARGNYGPQAASLSNSSHSAAPIREHDTSSLPGCMMSPVRSPRASTLPTAFSIKSAFSPSSKL